MLNMLGGKSAAVKTEEDLTKDLATAELWGSYAQFVSLLGSASIGAAAVSGLVAAGGAAMSMIGSGGEETCRGIDGCAGAAAQFNSGGPTIGFKVIGDRVLDEVPDDDGDNVFWTSNLPTAKPEESQEKIVGRQVTETKEGELQFERFIREQKSRVKLGGPGSSSAMAQMTNLPEKQLFAQGYTKQQDGTFMKVVESDPVMIEVDAEETLTKMTTHPPKYHEAKVEFNVPHVTWKKEVFKIRSQINSSPDIEVVTNPTTITKEMTPVEFNFVRPKADSKKDSLGPSPQKGRVRRSSRQSRLRGGDCACGHCVTVAPMMVMGRVPIAHTYTGGCLGPASPNPYFRQTEMSGPGTYWNAKSEPTSDVHVK